MAGFGGDGVREVSPKMWHFNKAWGANGIRYRVGESFSCGENSLCKGPEAGNHLMYLISMAKLWWVWLWTGKWGENDSNETEHDGRGQVTQGPMNHIKVLFVFVFLYFSLRVMRIHWRNYSWADLIKSTLKKLFKLLCGQCTGARQEWRQLWIRPSFWDPITWIKNPVLPHTNWMTMCELLNFSMPWFHRLQNANKNSTYLSYWYILRFER